MVRNLVKRARKDRGISSVEYIIILVLVALTGIAVFKLFGGSLKTKMTTANNTFNSDSCSDGVSRPTIPRSISATRVSCVRKIFPGCGSA